MSRVLVIPAAGLGSRLGDPRPKVLVPVAGVPMIDRLLTLYAEVAPRAVVVAAPSFAGDLARHLAPWGDAVEIAIQPSPTGMLDAILRATDAARRARPERVWITWCDQVAVDPRTVARLAAAEDADPEAALLLPTVRRPEPYIHLMRDASGTITRVLHQREGDPMPAEGEGDMGLFALTATAFLEDLPRFAREAPLGAVTGERNFLPFVPWLARRAKVTTIEAHHLIEAVGVNTPEDLAAVEAHLRHG